NTGRETFLAPVKWDNGWPTINPGHEEVQYRYPYPISPSTDSIDIPTSGNFRTRDEFDSPKLNLNWIFLRTPHEKWYDLTQKKGCLTMRLKPETCAGSMNPSFLGRRQQHRRCSVSTALLFTPKADNEKAGLLVFQNEKHFYFLCKSSEKGGPVIQLYASDSSGKSASGMELIASSPAGNHEMENEVMLKIEAKEDIYSFSYSVDPGRWILLKDSVDARFLSTKVAGGFVGCMVAMYATSQKQESNTVAAYNWFEYSGDDEVYK